MVKRDPRTCRILFSLGPITARVAGIVFVPMLLPASWTGAVGTAWAGCDEPSPGNHLCTGSSAGEQVTNSTGPLTIIADSSLKIDSATVGFGVEGHGTGITFSQVDGSVIKGATTGIHSTKYGAGPNKLTVAGEVIGSGDHGIFAYNDADATDVVIEQTGGTISGVTHGIRVDNYGPGSTAITTAGTVTQSGSTTWDAYGVYAYNDPSATDITLTQTGGAVSGQNYGIYGNNQGTGSTVIGVAGDVTATEGIGVAGYNGGLAQDIRINQTTGTITGHEFGMVADNGGTGSIQITSSGRVSGGIYGIYASQAGAGPTAIAIHGDVNGDAGAGILSVSGSDVTIDIAPTGTVGTVSGLAIFDAGTGNALVTSAGRISGDTSLGLGDDVFNLAGGSYTGNIFGDVRGAADSDDGLVNAEGNDTFTWTSGTFTGGFYGQDGSDTATVSAATYDGSQILDGGDGTSIANGMIDTLNLRGVNARAPGGNIANWELVRMDGGMLAIKDGAWKVGMANEAGTGVFLNNGATLDGMAALALDGRLTIDATSAFMARGGGDGVYAVSGDVGNAGVITLQDAAAGDVMTIGGNYVGTDGRLRIDTVLGADDAKTDRLHIAGDTAGTTRLLVNNVNGTGAPTAEGIRVIGIDGRSAGSFALAGGDYTINGKPAIVAGAYAYQLHQGGLSTPDDGDWYLRSQRVSPAAGGPEAAPAPLYQAGVPSYEAYPQALLALNSVPTLQQRVGNRVWTRAGHRLADSAGSAGALIEGTGAWGRMEGAYRNIKPRSSTSETAYDQNIFRMQIGVDRELTASENGKWIGGLAVHYAHGKTHTRSPHGDGDITTDGYGVGATLTWYQQDGFYLDGQARLTWYDSDLGSKLARKNLVQANKGFGYASSIEGGKRIALDPAWSITPQAQLVYSNVGFDTYTDTFGARVSNGQGDSLQGRLGVALDYERSRGHARGKPVRTHVYGLANLHYEILDETTVHVAGKRFASGNDRLWASLGVGGSYNWSGDKYSIYGEGLVNTGLNPFGDSYSVVGQVGFRMRW